MKLTDNWMYVYNNPQLHIISDDKKYIVSYQPQQKDDNPYLIIKGKELNETEKIEVDYLGKIIDKTS